MRLTESDITAALSMPMGGIDANLIPAERTEADVVFTGVSSDTRSLQPDNLFVALINEKADGHHYIDQAIDNGATGIVIQPSATRNMRKGISVFQVRDTQVAYGQIARAWREMFDIPVIGITGSVGKTSTKEMLALALSPLGPVLKTEANQNTETGVPMALLRLNEEHKAAVIEMGMRGRGQIAYLCDIARPTIGVISRIAENHIELLGSLDAIADAKGELIESLPSAGVAFLNANDPYFVRLACRAKCRVVGSGLDQSDRFDPTDPTPAADVRTRVAFMAERLETTPNGWRFTIAGQTVVMPSPARHDVGNAAAAFAVAVTLGAEPAAVASALAGYQPEAGRMQVQAAAGWSGTVLNDAYNAAPASMRSALETLVQYPGGRKIGFLADMKELGDVAPTAHAALGDTIAELGGIDALYTVGHLAALIPAAEKRFENSEEAAAFLSSLDLRAGDVVLVKGSHSMKMELVVAALLGKGASSDVRG